MTAFLRASSWHRPRIGRLTMLLGSAFVAMALVAACGGDDDDGAGSGAEEGGDGGGSESTVIEVSATSFQFSSAVIEMGEDEAFTVRFANNDDGVPHSFAIFDDDGAAGTAGAVVSTTGVFSGVAEQGFEVSLGLPAGTYRFQCEVHANMTGTMNVS